MVMLWDYDRKELEKTEKGRLFILERMINYGIYPHDKDRIDTKMLKKYWDKIAIDADRREFIKLLLWEK